MKLSNIFGHLKTVLKHKWIVFRLSIKAGIPIRGFFHDISKFSPVEFWESAKFYQGGKKSPIGKAKQELGYSKAWLHHKGRNKHHFEYWFHSTLKEQPIIPFKYCVETVCDKLSASMVYEGKNWTKESELKYWLEHEYERSNANDKIKDFFTEVFTEVSKKGVDEVISKKNLKRIYNLKVS